MITLYTPIFHKHESSFLPKAMDLYYFCNGGHFYVPDSTGCLTPSTDQLS